MSSLAPASRTFFRKKFAIDVSRVAQNLRQWMRQAFFSKPICDTANCCLDTCNVEHFSTATGQMVLPFSNDTVRLLSRERGTTCAITAAVQRVGNSKRDVRKGSITALIS